MTTESRLTRREVLARLTSAASAAVLLPGCALARARDANQGFRAASRPAAGAAAGDPAVRWTGTFEDDPWDASWGFNFGSVGDPPRAQAVFVDGVSRNGRVLQVTFNPDGIDDRESNEAKYGVNMLGAFPLMGIEPMEEAWFRYFVYLPEDWDAAGGGKMPGLAGNLDVIDAPGTTSGGGRWNRTSWSGRVMWQNETHDQRPSRPIPRTYLYVISLGGEDIESHRAPTNNAIYGFGRPWGVSETEHFFMRLGEWNMIEVHYRMNTSGVEDGLFEGWLWNSDYPEGVRGAYHDNIQYRDGDHGELAINQLQLAHYYGGVVGPSTTQYMYFDDFAISSQPIGQLAVS